MIDQRFSSSASATALAPALARAEDALARLDERLATSPIAAAFAARTDILDAAAALHLEGELVPLEDLALHDAAADARAPTIAVTRAHAVLRARRRIAAAAPGWALTANGLDALRGASAGVDAVNAAPLIAAQDAVAVEEDAFAAELAAIDTLIARSASVLAGRPPAPLPHFAAVAGAGAATEPSREDRLAAWRAVVAATEHDPPVLAAARAVCEDLAPLPNAAWLGRLLVADLLRARGKTRCHLAALNLGHKLARRAAGGRRPRDAAGQLAAAIATLTHAAETGLADHDRWLQQRRQLERRLVGRRSTSRLPDLVDLVLRAPVVSSQTIADELKVSTRAAQNLVVELGLRELTGRRSYRCWGVL